MENHPVIRSSNFSRFNQNETEDKQKRQISHKISSQADPWRLSQRDKGNQNFLQLEEDLDFQTKHVQPQLIKAQQSRMIPKGQKRVYGETDYDGGHANYRRLLSPIYKSDYPTEIEPFAMDGSQSSWGFSDVVNSFAENFRGLTCRCPPQIQCKCTAPKILKRENYADDNQTTSTQDEDTKPTQFDHAMYLQLLQAQKDKLQRSQNLELNDPSAKMVKMEDQMIRLRENLREREVRANELSTGMNMLKSCIEDEIRLSEEMKKVISNDLGNISFYEMHPHLIYQERRDSVINPPLNNAPAESVTGFIEELKLIYNYQENHIIFLSTNLSQNIRGNNINLNVTSAIKDVKFAILPNRQQQFILIITTTEILVYQYLFCQNQLQLELKNKENKILHENQTQRCFVFQSKTTKRLFYGNQSAQLKEITLEEQQPQRGLSQIVSCFSLGQKKRSQSQGPQPTSQSFVDKIKSFFANKITQMHEVTGCCEHEQSNTIFVIVRNILYPSQSYIDVYTQGPLGFETKHLFKIQLQEIYALIFEKFEIQQFANFFDKIEIQKLWVTSNEFECQDQSYLNILFSNGMKITILLQFKEILLTESEKEVRDQMCLQEKTLEISDQYQIVKCSQIPFSRLVHLYLNLFDRVIQEHSSQEDPYLWKPLIADPINLSQKNEPLADSYLEIIDHYYSSKQGQDFYLIRLQTEIESTFEKSKQRGNNFIQRSGSNEDYGYQINQQQNLDDENFNRIPNSASLYFLVLVQPNYRRQKGMRHTQQIVSLIELSFQSEPVALFKDLSYHYSQSRDSQDESLRLSILTQNGTFRTLVAPSRRDIMTQYLKLLDEYDNSAKQQQHLGGLSRLIGGDSDTLLGFIKSDIATFYRGQTLQETLDTLLSIILSQNNESYQDSSLVSFFYKNLAGLLKIHDYTVRDKFQTKYELYPGVSSQMRQIMLNYKQSEQVTEKAFTPEIKQLAADIFIDITFPLKAAEFDTLILNNTPFQNAWFQRSNQKFGNNLSQNISTKLPMDYIRYEQAKLLEKSEFERVKSIYRFIYNQMSGLLEQPLFALKATPNQKQEVKAIISLVEVDRIRDLILQIKYFVSQNRTNIVQISEQDNDQNEETEESSYSKIKQEVQCLLQVLDRFYDSLLTLSQIIKSDITQKLILELFKDIKDQKDLCSICLIEFIEVGLENQLISVLVENFITRSIDCRQLLGIASLDHFIKTHSNTFIPEIAFSLILGRKLMSESLKLKTESLRQPSYSQKLSHSLLSTKSSLTSSYQSYQQQNNSKGSHTPEQDQREKDMNSLMHQGFHLYLRWARCLNLPQALMDLARNKMWRQMMQLTVHQFDQLDKLTKILTFRFADNNQDMEEEKDQGFNDNPNEASNGRGKSQHRNVLHDKNMEWLKLMSDSERQKQLQNISQQKEKCIIMMYEIVEEISKRANKASYKKNENKELEKISKFDCIKEFVKELNKEKNLESLKILQLDIFEECLSSTSRAFHIDFYDVLFRLRELDQIFNFPKSNNTFLSEFLKAINTSSDIQYHHSDRQHYFNQDQSISSNKDFVQSLECEAKLNTQILHQKFQECMKAQLYVKLYKDVMSYVCSLDSDHPNGTGDIGFRGRMGGNFQRQNQHVQSIMNVKDRISFMIKAEGGLTKHQELMKDDSYLKYMAQDPVLNPYLSLEEIKRYDTFRDYFMIVNQVCEKISLRITKLMQREGLSKVQMADVDRKQSLLKKIFKVFSKNQIKEDQDIELQTDNQEVNLDEDEDYILRHNVEALQMVRDNLIFRIIDPDELYQLTISLKCWPEYLNIIRLTELRDELGITANSAAAQILFGSQFKSIQQNQNLLTSQQKIQDTQARINYLYQCILDTYYNKERVQEMGTKANKFSKFTAVLESLRSLSGGIMNPLESKLDLKRKTQGGLLSFNIKDQQTNTTQIIDLFPIQLIFSHVEEVNKEFMSSHREDKILRLLIDFDQIDASKLFRWDPLWHAVYLCQKCDDISEVFEHFAKMRNLSSTAKAQREQVQLNEPEQFFSTALTIFIWFKKLSQTYNTSHAFSQLDNQDFKDSITSLKKSKEDFRNYRPQMLEAVERLKISISDDLLFSKSYVDLIHRIIQRLSLILSENF